MKLTGMLIILDDRIVTMVMHLQYRIDPCALCGGRLFGSSHHAIRIRRYHAKQWNE